MTDDFAAWEAELAPVPMPAYMYAPHRRPQWTAERPAWAPSPYPQPRPPRRWWRK